MQSLRTASGHLPIMHDLLLSRVLCFLHNLGRTVCQEHSFQNYNSWYYVMGKQSHITDSTERGTSDSYCDKLVFYLNSGLKLSLRPTHFYPRMPDLLLLPPTHFPDLSNTNMYISMGIKIFI